MTKQCVGFSLIATGTLKEDCEIKTSEILSSLPLMNKVL